MCTFIFANLLIVKCRKTHNSQLKPDLQYLIFVGKDHQQKFIDENFPIYSTCIVFVAGTKFLILPILAGGVSLSKSGIVPTGRSFPIHKPGANTDYINPGDVNLHLLPSNPQANDQYMVHATFRPDKAGGSATTSVQFMISDVPKPLRSLMIAF